MATKKSYVSREGGDLYWFKFKRNGRKVDIYCTRRPSLNGRGSDPHRTHLYHSGKLCFHAGKEPETQQRAEELAAQWAEYFSVYRKTGRTQS